MSGLTIGELRYGGKKMPWASYVVAGPFIFLSGTEGRDPSKEQEYPDGTPDDEPMFVGLEGQTRAALTKIVDRVREAGGSPEDIVIFNTCLRNRTDWPAYHQISTEFWREHCPDIVERPRAAGLFVTDVMMDRMEMLVDIWAIAYKPEASS